MNKYCNNSWKTILEMLKSDMYKGLTEIECSERRKHYGDNKILLSSGSERVAFFRSFFRIYILIDLVIAVYLFYMQENVLAIICGILTLVQLIIKFIYGNKKEKNYKFLQTLNHTTTTVLRDGVEKIVKSEELVKGDIVLFSKGSLIAADLRIINATDIKVDEKNITGENFLKDKFDSKMEGNSYLIEEMKNILFKGSIIKEGHGTGVVVETGNTTQLGKMLTMITNSSNNKHGLLKVLEKRLSRLMLVLLILIIGINYGLTYIGQEANGLIPSLFALECLPVALIASLHAVCLKRALAKEGINLINISTLDMIKEIQVLFMDKVGAVTREEMILTKVYANNNIYFDREINYTKDSTLKRLIEILVLCNNSTFDSLEKVGKGDLMEVAYLKFAASRMVNKYNLEKTNPRLFEVPMDSDKRMLTTINRVKKCARANIKGNVDAILDRCNYIMVGGLEKEITAEDIQRIKAMDYNFALEGLNTQGVAYRSFNYIPSQSENIENNLVFVGIVALENPLSNNINEEIDELKNKGIIPILFTNDNKITASSLAQKVKLTRSNSRVVTGVEVDCLSSQELIDVVSKSRVFSRANPETKAMIVGMYTNDNYKVAVCGENLGDLPLMALSRVGISKGKAPEIIKKISDVYIEKKYLEGFLNLFKVSNKFEKGMNKFQEFIKMLLITELILVNAMPYINNVQVVSYIPLLIINVLLGIPLGLALLQNPNDNEEKISLRTILVSVLAIWGVYGITDGCDTALLIILGGLLVIYTFMNCNKVIRKASLASVLIGLSFILLVSSIVILSLINGVSFDIYVIIRIGVILIIYLIFELILKKGQR
ncbi:MAG: cation-transporting P-type ATPase [Clostridiaceae bacterium]|nr:cation-transporting P-type ATPase [Clostridiaceae bacterium]